MQYHLIALYVISRMFRLKIPIIGPTISKIINHFALFYTSCDVSPLAEIDLSVRFPHPVGIVIGEGVKIGANTKIWQQVTIGSHGREIKEYPVIGEGVKVFSKASILGNVNIGNNSTIGAHSLVLISIPENTTARGVPARLNN